jgi:hypothetical protein
MKPGWPETGWQWVRFAGNFINLYYIPYVIFMGWSVLRTGDRAARNFFERQAGLASGGYIDYPVRPIGEAIRATLGRLKLTRS